MTQSMRKADTSTARAPARVTPEQLNEAIDRLAHGQPHAAAAQAVGLTARELWRAIQSTPQTRAAYAEAKLARASAAVARANRVAGMLEEGKIDPKSANVLISHEQWLAKTEAPHEYGDRQIVEQAAEQAVPPGTTVQVAIQQLVMANPQLLGVLQAAQQPVAAAAALPPAGADPMFACE